MNDIWFLKDEGKWIKLKYRPDLSGLSDVFEFMENNIERRFIQGRTMTMDYGCMGSLMDKGELLIEEDYNNRNIQLK